LRVYYTSQRGHRLHQAVWERHNGPIPDGHHVHHRDGNPLNNDIGNLECVSSSEHAREHMSPERSARAREWFASIRPLAAEWHGTPEGRAWHAEHAKRLWETRQPLARKCDQCGVEFGSLGRRESDRFCSNNCKSTWRRRSGVDDVDRACSECSAAFRVNRYSAKRTCSRECAGRRISRTRRASVLPRS